MRAKLLLLLLLSPTFALANTMPTPWGPDPFTDPFVYFAGVTGVHDTESPNSYTLKTFTLSPFTVTPITVTLTQFGGDGDCQPGSCKGLGTSVVETFSTSGTAMFLPNLPAGVVTTASFYEGLTLTGTISQTGGTLNHMMAPGFEFNKIVLDFSAPASYDFTFESFDAAVPEPASLTLAGIALLGGFAAIRRRG